MKRNEFEIEICAGNIQSVIAAEKGGADRVELCDNLLEGGTTPSIGTIILAKEKTNIAVFPIIRPRGGDFVYSDLELEIMKMDVEAARIAGADGIVIGCLKNDGSVDKEKCCRLIEAAKGLPVTFHRAFDVTNDPFTAFHAIKSMGIKRILTSGQQATALDGIELLAQLNLLANNSVKIMAGAGVNTLNIQRIAKETGVKAFHASLSELHSSEIHSENSPIKFNYQAVFPENKIKISSASGIKQMINNITELGSGIE